MFDDINENMLLIKNIGISAQKLKMFKNNTFLWVKYLKENLSDGLN